MVLNIKYSQGKEIDDGDPLFLVALIQLELSGGRIGGGSELQTDPAVENFFKNVTYRVFLCLFEWILLSLEDGVDPLFLVNLIELELLGGHIRGSSKLQTEPTVNNLSRNISF